MHSSHIRTAGSASTAYCLRFEPLAGRGRPVEIPCNSNGEVNLDVLSEIDRTRYLGARALIGALFALPLRRHMADE